jgi:hypothetical protein
MTEDQALTVFAQMVIDHSGGEAEYIEAFDVITKAMNELQELRKTFGIR